MNIDNINFTHILTTTLIVELYMLILFRYTKSVFSIKAINDWYDNYKLTAILLDIFIVIIGFYLTIFTFKYFKLNKYYQFLILQLIIQIVHDILFYIFFSWYPKNSNSIIDDFKIYAKKTDFGAIVGDSFMYLIGVPILFLLLNIKNNNLIFIAVLCSYLIGYLIYQKPLYKFKTFNLDLLLPLLSLKFINYHIYLG